MSILIPIIIGSIALGRSFDVLRLTSNPYYIYDRDAVLANIQVTKHEVIEQKYEVIDNFGEILQFLEADPAIALKTISGINVPIYTTIPLNNFRRSVLILLHTYVETESGTFPPTTTLKTEWQTKPQAKVGTHYIKGLKLGGELLVSIQIRASTFEDLESIKSRVQSAIGKRGSIDHILSDKLEQIIREIGDKVSLSISAFSSISTAYPPSSVNQAVKLSTEFPSMIKQMPRKPYLKIELEDLHTLQSNFTEYKENQELIPKIKEAYERYLDIGAAMRGFRSWQSEGKEYSPENEKLINEFWKKLVAANRALSKAVSNVDETGAANQFDESFKIYGNDKGNEKYVTDLDELIQKVDHNNSINGPTLIRNIISAVRNNQNTE